jgi:hypothetical protein
MAADRRTREEEESRLLPVEIAEGPAHDGEILLLAPQGNGWRMRPG